VCHLSFALHVLNFLHPDPSLSGRFQEKSVTPDSATLDLAPPLGSGSPGWMRTLPCPPMAIGSVAV